ncbi:MAG: radical SAM protein [Candidatus Aenigmarchaeota archaeon]|nr:radical SAM protein [Candidatus Aenigmarchaeota archaeon]
MAKNSVKKSNNSIFLLDAAGSCNNDCIFCTENGSRPERDLTLDEIILCIDSEKLKMGATVILCGGEPTVNPDIFEIISYIKNIGCKAMMITNGRMLSDLFFAKKLIDCGLEEVLTEIHSHIPEMHDFFTQRPGSFKETLEGTDNFLGAGGVVCMKILLTRATYRFLPKTIEFVCKRMPKIKEVMICSLSIQGSAKKNQAVLGVRFCDAMPYVEKAIDVAVKFNVSIRLDMVPLCALHTQYQKFSNERSPHVIHKAGKRLRISKDMPQLCFSCILNETCPGLYKCHLDLFGENEIKPVLELSRT